MARIPYPDPATLPEADRDFLANLPQLNIHRLLAGSPSMFRPLVRLFSAYLNEGLLDKELREIAILRVAHLTHSEYELINHVRAARVIGMADQRIDAVRPGADRALFTAEEQLVLDFVDEVVNDGGASRGTFDAVSKYLSTAQVIELTAVIGVYVMVSQICATFEVEPEDVPIADTGIEDMKRTVDKLG